MRVDYFMVSGTDKIEHNGRPYNHTFHAGVVAVGVEEAIAATREDHPTAVIWSVSHRGEVQKITQQAAEATKEKTDG